MGERPAEDLRSQIAEAIEHLDGWELETVARLARRMDAQIGYGNPSFVLGFPRFRNEGDLVKGEFEVGEIHLNPHRIAHGLVAYGLLDNAMGHAVATFGGEIRLCVTLEIKVQYARALHPGPIAVEARCLHRGRTVGLAEGRVTDSDGRLAVFASGTYHLTEGRLGDRGDR
ncbi:MAG TPA: PaaI family thioesterase [Actinomycetota bacterium]|nr:PaaI family thioesterase [Actinomycetota bacterium]